MKLLLELKSKLFWSTKKALVGAIISLQHILPCATPCIMGTEYQQILLLSWFNNNQDLLHPQLPPIPLNYQGNLLNLSTGVKWVRNRKELGSFFQIWLKADFISEQFAIGLIPLHGLYKQGVLREGLFIPNYSIILVSPISCIPFSNKESEWLHGEQILPLPIFLSKPLAEAVKRRSSRMCQKQESSYHSIYATQTQCLGISCESASLPCASHRASFVLSPLSEQDCTGKEGLQLLGPLAECSWRKCCQTPAGINLHSLFLMQMFTGGFWDDGLSSVLSGRVETQGLQLGGGKLPFAQILLVGQIPEPVLTRFPAQKNSSTDLGACLHMSSGLLLCS